MVTSISYIQSSRSSFRGAWKPNHSTLRNNNNGSLARLSILLWKLRRDPLLFKEYDDKIKEQLAEEFIEKVRATTTLKEFYIQYKPAVKQPAERTKL